MSQKQTCFLVAGEPSGDLLGAQLLEALRQLNAPLVFRGVGGPLMRKAGLVSLFRGEEMAVMGFFQVLPHVVHLARRMEEIAQEIIKTRPALVVTIDSPSFNMRLIKKLRKMKGGEGIKVIHYVAPSVWAWKSWRAARMAQLYDGLLTLLPFEAPYFECHGLATYFVGHPAAWWQAKSETSRELRKAFCHRHKLNNETKAEIKNVALFAGSRAQEIKLNGAVMLETLRLLASSNKTKFNVVCLAAEGMDVSFFVEARHFAGIENVVIVGQGEREALFAAADFALAVSGTVSVELSAMSVPHVVLFRMGILSEWIVRLMVKVNHASLVNIAAGRALIPEFLFSNCRADTIATACAKLLHDDHQLRVYGQALRREVNQFIAQQDEHPSMSAARALLQFIP